MYKSTVLSGLGLVTDTEEQPMSMFFAPNNTAFQQVPQEVLNRLRASTQASAKEREEVLLYHLGRWRCGIILTIVYIPQDAGGREGGRVNF